MTKGELLRESEILKEGYVKLLNDRDVMVEWGKPQLEALYATKIGALQLERLKLQLSIKGMKRKVELVYQYINRNEQPDFISIEFNIAQELAEAEKELMMQTAALSDAKILLTHLSSPDRSAALRKVFRTIAKHLHPDVNPNLTDEQLQIWYKIKEAYSTGDLERLKALQVVYDSQITKGANTDEMSEEAIILSKVESELRAEIKIEVQREQGNQYDEFAVVLKYGGNKIGYLLKNKNETIARLLDAGKRFYAVLIAKEWEGHWLRLDKKSI